MGQEDAFSNLTMHLNHMHFSEFKAYKESSDSFISDTISILSESEIASVYRLIAQMVIIDNTSINFVSKPEI